MPFTQAGTKVLGAPVGTDAFCVGFATEKNADIASDIDVIGRMQSLQAQHCLLAGAVQHRINHMLRNVPGAELLYNDSQVTYDSKLLSVPLRIARRTAFPEIQRALCGLSLSRGGLGYRTWKSTADCAHLASYIHASIHIPAMFPALACCFPPILTLVPRVGPVPAPLSQRADLAVRAFVRLSASAPLLRERIENAKGPLRHTQHVLASAFDEAEPSALLNSSRAPTTQDFHGIWNCS